MLPYFIFTEEIQGFCSLMGYTIDNNAIRAKYVCMYTLDDSKYPYIDAYNLNLEDHPYIPEAKVIDYLALILNGYSYEDAVKELGVVGNGRSSSA